MSRDFTSRSGWISSGENVVPLRVSVSGVRGVVGDGLDATVVMRWAAAFGTWLPPGPVVVGRDTRPSGDMVLHAVAAALMSTGHDVWDIGIATTPTTEMAVADSEAVGGIIITASHNPQPWNALKFLEGRGLFLTASQNHDLAALLDCDGGHVAADSLGQLETRSGADVAHIAGILALPWLDPEAIRQRNLRVVVDAVEGAGGSIVPALLAELGVECMPLNCGLSGRFPHDPEPTPAHLAELGAAVRDAGADLGFAVDPDVDRLALVDDNGVALSEELTLVMAVDFLLGKQNGPVVVNLSTTRLIEEVAGRHGAEVLRTPVGEANVVETLMARDGVIGGEGNGGVIYPALHPGRDALVGIAMILQLLTEREASLTDLVAALPPVVMIKEKVANDMLPTGEELALLLASLGPGAVDDRDGLKWIGEDAWVHVRPSNTEPVVRIIAEACDTETAQRLISRIRAGRSA
ncbi:MAG: phosphoglucosamine mutase [bacterium]